MTNKNNILYTNTQPSLCIPRIEKGVREKDIFDVFKRLSFGEVERVDIVSWKKNTSENQFVRVFIHFKFWNDHTENIRKKLLSGCSFNIVHDFPWFWKIVASRLPKPN